MTTNTIIKTDNLSFGCRHIEIIKHMNLSVAKGEFIGIFGQNGSGKSTFLKTLLGQLVPMSGSLTLFGEPPKKGNRLIGYMPQSRNHIGIHHLTCEELLKITLQGQGLGLPFTSKRNQQTITDVLQLVEAYPLKDRCINQLSGGELKRIHLAQALLNQPQLLLLDEPLANLDPRMQDVFVNILDDIRRKLTITVLMTAHNPNALLHAMDRALYLGNQQALIGPIDQVINSKALTQLYGTPIDVVKVKDRLLVLGEYNNNESEDIHHHAR